MTRPCWYPAEGFTCNLFNFPKGHSALSNLNPSASSSSSQHNRNLCIWSSGSFILPSVLCVCLSLSNLLRCVRCLEICFTLLHSHGMFNSIDYCSGLPFRGGGGKKTPQDTLLCFNGTSSLMLGSRELLDNRHFYTFSCALSQKNRGKFQEARSPWLTRIGKATDRHLQKTPIMGNVKFE